MKRGELRRKTPLPRGTAPVRSAGVRPVNPARRQSEFARCYGSRQRVAFVKALCCCVPGCLTYPSECAHVVNINGGAGRKSDAEACAPLCRHHHAEQHAIGVQSFAARYALNLAAEAARVCNAWAAHQARSEAA